MPADDNYNPLYPIGASRRRLPFDSNSVRMSSSTGTAAATAMKRSVSHPRHEIFLNQSSSSLSMTDENDDDGEVKMLDETLPENTAMEGSKRKTFSNHHRHQPTMSKDAEKRDRSAPMIEELLQSNMDLKKEIREIRRQIKHHNGSTKKSVHSQDRTANNRSSKPKIFNGEDEEAMCSFRPPESEYDNEPLENREKIHQYKKEATVYKQQLDACQETIAQLRKTIDTMDRNLGHLKTAERRQGASHQHESSSTVASNNNTDHRFIHELFHLCLKSPSRSSKWSTTVPSHHDMKTFIRQTFNELNKSPRKSLQQLNTNSQQESNHFVCKCSDRIHNDHRPSYQYCLTIIEQCQSLFDVLCFAQLPTALNELYYRVGELTNFKRSIASTLSVTENSRLVSCPKLIKILQQLLDDARSNELISFKKMAKISDMNEAVSKIRSYDDFVPYYHQFIEQMANLLEVSKGDEIMPAIKTLKLLAHADSRRPSVSSSQAASQSLTRASSMNLFKSPYDDLAEKNLMHSKSLRVLSSSRSTAGESEQPVASSDNRD